MSLDLQHWRSCALPPVAAPGACFLATNTTASTRPSTAGMSMPHHLITQGPRTQATPTPPHPHQCHHEPARAPRAPATRARAPRARAPRIRAPRARAPRIRATRIRGMPERTTPTRTSRTRTMPSHTTSPKATGGRPTPTARGQLRCLSQDGTDPAGIRQDDACRRRADDTDAHGANADASVALNVDLRRQPSHHLRQSSQPQSPGRHSARTTSAHAAPARDDTSRRQRIASRSEMPLPVEGTANPSAR
ncbi:hypothetical protein SAMN05421869_113303 [Nonomuraea jiangxiensis]|uniref:Uncharacterized protein n=1 Tax=Nonomuraea jiangxiensis TaxID=633440 RepID=A0A1G8YKU9_9ACTN|nr:hypothetical protein SAMN05421869_113303 [Nonomuraea jiangxiensis]